MTHARGNLKVRIETNKEHDRTCLFKVPYTAVLFCTIHVPLTGTQPVPNKSPNCPSIYPSLGQVEDKKGTYVNGSG